MKPISPGAHQLEKALKVVVTKGTLQIAEGFSINGALFALLR
jgi:hypothetical protein